MHHQTCICNNQTGSGQEAFNLKGHTGFVYCVAFSPDGSRLVSASEKTTVKVWQARSYAQQ